MLKEIIDFILSISNVVALILFCSSPLWWNAFISLIKTKVELSIKKEYDKELEELRGKINKSISEQSSLLSMYANTHDIAQQRRISATEVLWKMTLAIRKALFKASYVDFFLTREEFEKVYTKSDVKAGITETFDDISLNDYYKLEEIDEHRPYLGEILWRYFFLYRQSAGRILYLYERAARVKMPQHWTMDEALRKILEKYLTPNEIILIYSQELGSITTLLDVLEQHILVGIQNIISGKFLLVDALNQVVDLESIRDLSSEK